MKTPTNDKTCVNIYYLFTIIVVINVIFLLCKHFIPELFPDPADIYRQAEIVKAVMFNDIPAVKNDYDEDSLVITLNRYFKTKMFIRKKETGRKEYGTYYYKIKDGNTMLRVKWQIDSSDAISIIEVCLVSVKNKKLRMIYPNEKDE